jgi:hypothetical protein
MMTFPIYGKIKIMFQTTNQSFYSAFINDQLMDRNTSRALANQHLGRLIGGQLTPRHEWGYSHVYGHPPYVCWHSYHDNDDNTNNDDNIIK